MENTSQQSGIETIEDYKKERQNQEAVKEDLNQNEKKQNSKEPARDFFLLAQKPGNPPLSYPYFARKLKMQGTVVLLFFVDERGLVDKIQLKSSSGHGELDNFVLRTLARYQFLENQEGWVRYKQSFILEGEEREYLRLRQEENEELSEDMALTKKFEQSALTPEAGEKKDSEKKELEKSQDEVEFIDYESLEKVERD